MKVASSAVRHHECQDTFRGLAPTEGTGSPRALARQGHLSTAGGIGRGRCEGQGNDWPYAGNGHQACRRVPLGAAIAHHMLGSVR